MTAFHKRLDIDGRLALLAQDSQYDLACACATRDDEHRRRTPDGTWRYPVVWPDGRRTYLLKTLISNVCVNDCKYCPLRAGQDRRRCTLEPEALVRVFLDYFRAGRVMGLFLSSGVTGTPDRAMERIVAVGDLLRRREHFRGYLHLKIMPGASEAAIEAAVRLATTVSVNIETPGAAAWRRIGSSKDFLEDIIRPMKTVSRLTAPGAPYRRVKRTTQFIVGASDETDQQIVRYTWAIYRRLHFNRVYFSAYQRGLGETDLPGEHSPRPGADLLTREHRLYQVDWLLRKYGFRDDEIPFEADGNLSLTLDPKEAWAQRHPDFFPVDIHTADREALLRVPGLGPRTVELILQRRRDGRRLRSIRDLGQGPRFRKAAAYLRFR